MIDIDSWMERFTKLLKEHPANAFILLDYKEVTEEVKQLKQVLLMIYHG